MAARVISAFVKIRLPFQPLRSFYSSSRLLSNDADFKRIDDEDYTDGEEDSYRTTKRQNFIEDINNEQTTRLKRWNDDEGRHEPRSFFNRRNVDRDGQFPRQRFGGYGDYNRRTPGFEPRHRDLGFDSSLAVDTPEYDPDLQKDVYSEDAMTADRTEEDIQNFYLENRIKVIGSNNLKPILSFEELTYLDKFKKNCMERGWTSPFPIQSVTWPIAMSGKDMVGIAQTGSGKTLGFVLPAIQHILKQRSKLAQRSYRVEPTVLVLTPTRELTQQVMKVANEAGQAYGITCGCAFGGSSARNQLRDLRGADICIATPGRLNDYLSKGQLSLRNCSYVVLDEADRMLDMGFEVQIKQILRYVKPNRQMLMWSATWPREIQQLSATYLNNPVHIRIGSMDLMVNPNISESFIMASPREKFEKLLDLLADIATNYPDECKTLIFTQRKRTADELSSQLMNKGIPSFALHGDKRQSERDDIMDLFRERKKILLIATDVASRGIDVADISNVINYDMPNDAESYVHRIGRTARGGRDGKAFSLVTRDDNNVLKSLASMFRRHKKKVPPQLSQLIDQGGRSRFSQFGSQRRNRSRSLGRPENLDPRWAE
ncbi:uncharacterized protein [Argopecten irradians]|uniref:uncharacterized protein n=1 Tax=Argopecten irradians TaxID=31199 RepID=UPI003721A7B7